MIVSTFHRALLTLSACTLASFIACGGGSGGGSDDSPSTSNRSACSDIGLSRIKIGEGEQCDSTDAASTSSVVQLSIVSNDGEEGACTGTVISSNTVLTAAHCVTAQDEETGEIIAADLAGVVLSFVVNGQRIEFVEPTSNILVHPGYNFQDPGYFFNDVAVIRTSQPIPAPAAALLASRPPMVGEEAIVAGYGQIVHEGPAQDELSAGVAIIRGVSENHVTINFTGNESHPCQGDSGGALFVRQGAELVVTGVVSQSDPSVDEENICRVGDVSLYANIQLGGTASFIQSVSPDTQYR